MANPFSPELSWEDRQSRESKRDYQAMFSEPSGRMILEETEAQRISREAIEAANKEPRKLGFFEELRYRYY